MISQVSSELGTAQPKLVLSFWDLLYDILVIFWGSIFACDSGSGIQWSVNY